MALAEPDQTWQAFRPSPTKPRQTRPNLTTKPGQAWPNPTKPDQTRQSLTKCRQTQLSTTKSGKSADPKQVRLDIECTGNTQIIVILFKKNTTSQVQLGVYTMCTDPLECLLVTTTLQHLVHCVLSAWT